MQNGILTATMSIPHPIPYQGSKRKLAAAILGYLKGQTDRLIEPFAGSAAISLAAAQARRAKAFALNDVNAPLMALWERILSDPEGLSHEYEQIWGRQLDDPQGYYNLVRGEFNKTQDPAQFLFLLARCVKASIRYNANGEFNQGPDNRRLGTRPETMRWNIIGASSLLRGRTELTSRDYRECLDMCTPNDVVYMDPPYQGVCVNRDPRYIEGVRHNDFVVSLESLNRREVPFIVSYDGRLGERSYGEAMPESLELAHIEIHVGRSSQATLLGRGEDTCESLYISPALWKTSDIKIPRQVSLRAQQADLFATL